MSVMATFTQSAYREAFERECDQVYPVVDAFEAEAGYAVDRHRLEAAAQILACPLKNNLPNWQHGRVLYAVTRQRLRSGVTGPVRIVDIGTAKGFSALVLRWALTDSGASGVVESVDVLDPESTEPRNSVLDLAGPQRLRDYLSAWHEAASIEFHRSTGIDWLSRDGSRVHVAFVDGKHSASVVSAEGKLLSVMQESGDVTVFDDVHILAVRAAVDGLSHAYDLRVLQVKPSRAYAIGVRR